MLRAPAVDGMFVGEPEDAALQLARLETDSDHVDASRSSGGTD